MRNASVTFKDCFGVVTNAVPATAKRDGVNQLIG